MLKVTFMPKRISPADTVLVSYLVNDDNYVLAHKRALKELAEDSKRFSYYKIDYKDVVIANVKVLEV